MTFKVGDKIRIKPHPTNHTPDWLIGQKAEIVKELDTTSGMKYSHSVEFTHKDGSVRQVGLWPEEMQLIRAATAREDTIGHLTGQLRAAQKELQGIATNRTAIEAKIHKLTEKVERQNQRAGFLNDRLAEFEQLIAELEDPNNRTELRVGDKVQAIGSSFHGQGGQVSVIEQRNGWTSVTVSGRFITLVGSVIGKVTFSGTELRRV